MSDKSIRITERQIVDAMDEMCHESLNPELHAAWEQIVGALINTRAGLMCNSQEVFPGTLEALNKVSIQKVVE